MPAQLSIQSFYRRETPSSPLSRPVKLESSDTSDGFTPDEVQAATQPLTQTWIPKWNYKETTISQLHLGAAPVKFTGRIVNFSDPKHRSFLPQSYLFFVLKDNTGAIAIKLQAHAVDIDNLYLGRLATVWTSYVADYHLSACPPIPYVALVTPIHLQPGSASCIRFHDDVESEATLFRTPLEFDPSSSASASVPHLLSLKAFLASGGDIGDHILPKVVVCVRSVGPRKTVPIPDRGETADLIEISVFDETADCTLTVWDDKIASARRWEPNRTILLITDPKPDKKKPKSKIGIGFATLVDVDPIFPDADWLRQLSATLKKKESVCIPFPEDLWDANEAMNGPVRILHRIADIDEAVRQSPDTQFTGKLNLIILGAPLTENLRRGTLCCLECCGIPLYSNNPIAPCNHCGIDRDLVLNPRIIGAMADETGCITAGKLVWSPSAWAQLFFPNLNEGTFAPGVEVDVAYGSTASWEDLTTLDKSSLLSIEEQFLHARITITFGWSSSVGRLCVLGVEW